MMRYDNEDDVIDFVKNGRHFYIKKTILVDMFSFKSKKGYYDMYINKDYKTIIGNYLEDYSKRKRYKTLNNELTDTQKLRKQITDYKDSNKEQARQQYMDLYIKRCNASKKKKKRK